MTNKDYNEVFTLTLNNRSKEMADNISKNNALLTRLKDKGKMRPLTGGVKILEELEYGEGESDDTLTVIMEGAAGEYGK